MSLLSAVARLRPFENLGSAADLMQMVVLLGALTLASYMVAKKLASVNN